MVVHTCNVSIHEAEAGGSLVWDCLKQQHNNNNTRMQYL
jgi:hypothetical protein